MEKDQEFKRKMHPEDAPLRRVHKIRFTDDEYRTLLNATKDWGFDKNRDFITYVSEQKSLPEGRDKNYSSKLRLKIKSLSSYVNMIDSGIGSEMVKDKLIDKVRELCQEYK